MYCLDKILKQQPENFQENFEYDMMVNAVIYFMTSTVE